MPTTKHINRTKSASHADPRRIGIGRALARLPLIEGVEGFEEFFTRMESVALPRPRTSEPASFVLASASHVEGALADRSDKAIVDIVDRSAETPALPLNRPAASWQVRQW